MILLISFLFSSQAVAAPALDTILSKPLQERLSEFRQRRDVTDQFLIRVARDKNSGVQARWRAVTTMGRLDPYRFQKNIDEALKSRDWFLRQAALIALQTDQRDRAVEWSMRLLRDPALMVRTQAVSNLILFDAREAEPLLWHEIWERRNFHGKESLWIRAHLAEAVAHFSVPGRTRAFEKLLLDPDPRLYKWAIEGLEASTGMRLTGSNEPIEVRRQKWLSRLGQETI